MNFPMLHIPVIGDGMTIALNAVLHVLISHGVAIGVIFFLVFFQSIYALGGNVFWKQAAKSLLVPALIATTSVGAVTGVGIWFITGILAPGGIGSLIHLFFWPWFIEWWAFTIEVILILIYFYAWPRLSEKHPKVLMLLGWGYVIIACISAVLISGILGFMLTPDGWPRGQTFSAAYFNPTFVVQFVLRIFAGVCIGGVLVLGWASWAWKTRAENRKKVLQATAAILMGCLMITAVSAYAYFSQIPRTFLTHWKFSVATSALSEHPEYIYLVNGLGMAVIILIGLAALFNYRKTVVLLFLPALACTILYVAQFERIREFVRGPYLIPGYMYANQIHMVENLASAKDGMLSSHTWTNQPLWVAPSARQGQALFDANCAVCHTIGGINDITRRLSGRTLEGVNAILSITDKMVPFMPPFSGTDSERLKLAQYLYYLSAKDTRPQPKMLTAKGN